MKCPKFHAALINDFQRCKDGDDDCLKEECACWSESCKMCSMTALSSDIGFIAGVLQNIETKMPHENQFRR